MQRLSVALVYPEFQSRAGRQHPVGLPHGVQDPVRTVDIYRAIRTWHECGRHQADRVRANVRGGSRFDRKKSREGYWRSLVITFEEEQAIFGGIDLPTTVVHQRVGSQKDVARAGWCCTRSQIEEDVLGVEYCWKHIHVCPTGDAWHQRR